MTTSFDDIPLSFAEDTVDVIMSKYAELQQNKNAFITSTDYTNLNRADSIHTLLIAIADNPTDNYNVDDIIKLAAYAAKWVEVMMTDGR